MFGDNSLTGVTDVEFVGSNCYVLTNGSASSKNKIYKFKPKLCIRKYKRG
ncbi:MAG TPA: hypothetical protein PK887_05260 [Ignavibacteriales bacterium]|nr:hypothetical protein [Ignavibacteriales bacterium]